jgi:predicted transcriptional regulator YheO
MLFALFLIVTSSTGMTTTHVGNYKDRAACEAAAKSVTIVIRDNATIGFVTMCIEAVER